MVDFALSDAVTAEIVRQLREVSGLLPPAVTPEQVVEAAQNLRLRTEPESWELPTRKVGSFLGLFQSEERPQTLSYDGEKPILPFIRAWDSTGDEEDDNTAIVGGWRWRATLVEGNKVELTLISTTKYSYEGSRPFTWWWPGGYYQKFPYAENEAEAQVDNLGSTLLTRKVEIELPWEISTLPPALLAYPGRKQVLRNKGADIERDVEYWDWVSVYYAPWELRALGEDLLRALAEIPTS